MVGGFFNRNQTRQLPNNGGSYQSPTVTNQAPAPMQGPAPANWNSPSLNNMYTGARTPSAPVRTSQPPAPRAPTQTPATGTSMQSPVSAEDKAYYINAIRESRGDIGNFAANAYANPNPSATDARINYGNIENTQMDVATGELDPYEIGSRSGISYSPAELGAIEKAMAGVYDPAIESAKATYERALRIEESEREHTQDMELQSAKAKSSGSGSSSTIDLSGTDMENFTTGNKQADAWISLIESGQSKITSVPKELKNIVAQGLAAKASSKSADSEVLDTLNTVNQMLNSSKLGKISGPIDQFAGGIFGEAATLRKQYNQLKGILALNSREKLKGSGAISDFEFRVLGDASTALGRELSDDEFRRQLSKIKGVMSTASGLKADVMVKNPQTGEIATGQLGRNEIDEAIKSGFIIEYI